MHELIYGGHHDGRVGCQIFRKVPDVSSSSLVGFSLDTILHTLTTNRPIKLYANCAHHRIVWVASDMERRQIRDYTAALCSLLLINCTPRRNAFMCRGRIVLTVEIKQTWQLRSRSHRDALLRIASKAGRLDGA